MPLSWNEIKDNALKFSREWAEESSEEAEAKSFWDGFFNIFGVSRRRVATFEQRIKKIGGKDGYIDLLWKGILLIEHKSRGQNLDRAYAQAKGYFPGLKDADLPRYILVSDFACFRLYDLDEGTQSEFPLKDLYQNVRLFGFIAGYQTTSYKEQDPVNIEAAERMGRLHDKLKGIGYVGHELEVYLVRLLFCLFADDTGIFERHQFHDLIEQRTAEDGHDLAQWLGHLFQVLDTPHEKRLKALDEQLTAFPYIDGRLFNECLSLAAFDREMRRLLLDCCALDWSRISPAVFGALFQSVMDPKLRRNLGAHYTSEKNILKLIKPLFLDGLRAEFEKLKKLGKKQPLYEFHQRLAKLKFFDPACGCGNFLVIAYRELRLLELEVLKAFLANQGTAFINISVDPFIHCNVDQFYGIEIEEFPAQIAQTALWLMDHQMNLKVSEAFGQYYVRLPLRKSATIIHGNALQLNWREIVKPGELSYILGNPPFGGSKYLNDIQREEIARIFSDVPGAGILDYVAAWYRKTAGYMEDNPSIKAAFVSTNSITQGEQVGVLWPALLKRGVEIHFAHRTFRWSSEARGKAAVHCVIIGFALHDAQEKWIFDYETPQSEPYVITAADINPYLMDGPDVVLEKRSRPVSPVPVMKFGNQPIDGGHLIFTPEEKAEFHVQEPEAERLFRRFIGADELINGIDRWCLWLTDASPDQLRRLPKVMERLEAVKRFRLESKREATRELAATPASFAFISHEERDYLLIPSVSSERRNYIPIGFMPASVIASNLCLIVPGATLHHFAILSSAMHMAWVRAVCGRLKSDYRYSAGIVYNNFPWPQNSTEKQIQAIEQAAKTVLDARAWYPSASLADLYDPLAMPPDLIKAHQKLDEAVDAAYDKKKFSGDAERVAFLFGLYQAITGILEPAAEKLGKKRSRGARPALHTAPL
jgi:hypothetical protein